MSRNPGKAKIASDRNCSVASQKACQAPTACSGEVHLSARSAHNRQWHGYQSPWRFKSGSCVRSASSHPGSGERYTETKSTTLHERSSHRHGFQDNAFPPLGQLNFFWHIGAPHRAQTYCPVKSPSSVVCNTRTRWSQYMLPAFSQDARSILAVSGVIVDSARLHRPCRVVQRLALSRS
jgi:hypothetical protein